MYLLPEEWHLAIRWLWLPAEPTLRSTSQRTRLTSFAECGVLLFSQCLERLYLCLNSSLCRSSRRYLGRRSRSMVLGGVATTGRCELRRNFVGDGSLRGSEGDILHVLKRRPPGFSHKQHAFTQL